MQIFSWNDILTSLNTGKENPFFSKGCGICVGSFDGLHKGHQFLLKKMIDSCKKNELKAGAVTFTRPLPAIKHPEDYKGDICTLNQRISRLEKIGLDFIILVDFDETFASMLGSDFFTILVNVCNLKLVAEGCDFRCGYKGAMDVQALKYFCEKNEINSIFINPVYYDSENAKIYTPDDAVYSEIISNPSETIQRVSSSHIRELLQKNFRTTADLLLSF